MLASLGYFFFFSCQHNAHLFDLCTLLPFHCEHCLSANKQDPQLSALCSRSLPPREPGDLGDCPSFLATRPEPPFTSNRLRGAQQGTVTHPTPKPGSQLDSFWTPLPPPHPPSCGRAQTIVVAIREASDVSVKDELEQEEHSSDLARCRFSDLSLVFERVSGRDGQIGNNCLFTSPHNQSSSMSLCTTEAHSLASLITFSKTENRGRQWLFWGGQERTLGWRKSVRHDGAPPKSPVEQSPVLYRSLELRIIRASNLSEEAVTNGYIIIH